MKRLKESIPALLLRVVQGLKQAHAHTARLLLIVRAHRHRFVCNVLVLLLKHVRLPILVSFMSITGKGAPAQVPS